MPAGRQPRPRLSMPPSVAQGDLAPGSTLFATAVELGAAASPSLVACARSVGVTISLSGWAGDNGPAPRRTAGNTTMLPLASCTWSKAVALLGTSGVAGADPWPHSKRQGPKSRAAAEATARLFAQARERFPGRGWCARFAHRAAARANPAPQRTPVGAAPVYGGSTNVVTVDIACWTTREQFIPKTSLRQLPDLGRRSPAE